MAGKKQLDPVELDLRKGIMTNKEASQNGTLLDQLVAARAVIAAHLDNKQTLARDLAALTRQYVALSEQIDKLEREQKADSKRGKKKAPTERGGLSVVSDSTWDAEAI